MDFSLPGGKDLRTPLKNFNYVKRLFALKLDYCPWIFILFRTELEANIQEQQKDV